ncbi:hypothetical protein [Erythrobacter ani]|uniref:DUF4398 domain-containing protein n=1 Tax=Erythrobacter ani TaxID=2827235 RepID=A0ABS6SJK7_9SPHN|nr:hypothetical protein [Erythrobacter ani]MBV7264653.1 hypothetical protein [Erythrobacter ani]
MNRATPSFLMAAVAAATLAGCAGDSGRYPSLAVRDVERAMGQFTPAAVENAEPIRPVASAADLAQVTRRAQESHRRFQDARSGATRLVESARGLSIESNARQRALVALADLTTLRSDTTLAVGDLDLLKAEAATTFAPTEEIDAARAEVAALVDEQNSALDHLWDQLR